MKTKNRLQQVLNAIALPFSSLKNIALRATAISTTLAGSLEKTDTRLLKTMDDYKINFDLDSKIAWNRHRLRELFETYKKIENYYALFFAFLGFIGVFYFDFIVLLFNKFNIWFLFTTITTTIGLLWSCYYIVRIVFTVEWCSDSTPRKIYVDLFDKKTTAYCEETNNFDLQDIDILVRKNYLIGLENIVTENTKSYNKKKGYVTKVLKLIIITLFIYSLNIIHYKIIKTMAKTTDDDYEIERADESKITPTPLSVHLTYKLGSTKEIITEKIDNKSGLNVDDVRKIVKEEIEIYFQNKGKVESENNIDKIKSKMGIKKD